jgi:biopolymer transport protein ExbD
MGIQIKKPTSGFVPASEMNVTPFIDVMLVLLVIFMVVAPISTVNIPLELPSSSEKPKAAPDKPIIISLKNDLALYIGEKQIQADGIGYELTAEGAKPETRIFLRADKRVAYGDLMGILDKLRASGFLHVSLVGSEER